MSTTHKRELKVLPEVQQELMAQYPQVFADLDHVRIDWMWAFAEHDDKTGLPIGPALKKNGIAADGICRKVSLKDRAKGLGDVEICIDGDVWDKMSPEEQFALADHEMCHIIVCKDRNGEIKTDDIGRPKITMRPHDFEVGWFAGVASRHGVFSGERRQARNVFDKFGQFFWPELYSNANSQTESRFANVEVSR